MDTITLQAGENDNGRRLDRILRKALPDYSLSLIHRLLRQKKVLVDRKPAAPDMRIQTGSVIHVKIRVNEAEPPNSHSSFIIPHFSPLPLLWRGSGIIVLNKPSGLSTHGPGGLDEMVRAFLEKNLPPSLSFKPGPLHRLDKGTSGVIAFSETIDGARLFSRLLRERKIIKIYLAVVEGRIKSELFWQDDLVRNSKAKTALTSIKALACNDEYTLAEVRIETGRTHQIRAQAAAHEHPLAGDIKYGGRPLRQDIPGGFFLHAQRIEFTEDTGLFPPQITAPLPQEFKSVVDELVTSF